MTDLPRVVRDADGKAIATYAGKDAADEHAARESGWKVTYDHWAAQNPGPKRTPGDNGAGS